MMFVDNAFSIPPSAPVRFLAVTQDGLAEMHEYPAGIAQAIAETLRAGGLRIVWYPAASSYQPKASGAQRRAAA